MLADDPKNLLELPYFVHELEMVERFSNKGEEAEGLWGLKETVALIESSPEFLRRSADLDRSYKLLNPLLRRMADTDDDLRPLAHSVYGKENIRLDQSKEDPVRWNDAATTRLIAHAIEAVEYADLIEVFFEAKRQDDPAYKHLDYHRADWGGSHFCEMKELYRIAASDGLCVVKDQTY